MFTEKEIELLNSFVAEFSRRAKHANIPTFELFMGRWYKFIDEVEKGYTLTIYDYTNDLFTRELIEELLNQVPDFLKRKLKPLIVSSDKRFDDNTRILKKPLSERDKPSWWWYRIPKKLIGDLEEDVKSMGLN